MKWDTQNSAIKKRDHKTPNIVMCVHAHTCIYTHNTKEREREEERDTFARRSWLLLCKSISCNVHFYSRNQGNITWLIKINWIKFNSKPLHIILLCGLKKDTMKKQCLMGRHGAKIAAIKKNIFWRLLS